LNSHRIWRHICNSHKPTLRPKIAKEPPSQRTKTLVNMDRHSTTERSPAGNSTYPKGGVSCSKDSFVVNQTLVFQIKFCGKNPALRVAANRYLQPQTSDSATIGLTEKT